MIPSRKNDFTLVFLDIIQKSLINKREGINIMFPNNITNSLTKGLLNVEVIRIIKNMFYLWTKRTLGK